MGRRFTIISTAVVTAVLTSAIWVFSYNIMTAAEEEVELSGDVKVVSPEGARPLAIAEGVVVGPAGMAVPVAGIKVDQLTDTYTQSRAGGARQHDALDILAPAGTPVVAAAPGRVEKLFNSRGGGGITAYVRSDDGRWVYYYAHLQGYAPGLAEGQRVERGQPIGRVGSTGNASARGPHLHFAINRMAPGERWWQGTAVNPYPLLSGRRS